jgi:hypothetical protein
MHLLRWAQQEERMALLRVADLIAHLQTLPQDLPVLAYDACEDTSELTLEGIRVFGDFEEFWFYDGVFRDDAHVEIIGG